MIDRLELDRYVTSRHAAASASPEIGRSGASKSGVVSMVSVSPLDPTPYKTITEAAAYLRSTPWFVRAQITSGALPYSKVGKRFVVATSDLDNLFERRLQR
jgi:excisionase family DNA binding protein